MKRILPLFLVIALIAGSCGTRSMNIQVMQPAQINVPQSVKTLVVVNHTIPINGWWNILEGILTGEMIEQDKRGKAEALKGLVSRMTESTRFKVINSSETFEGKGSITGLTFPEPLDWRTIENLCKKYKADAVLSLEYFDSDYIVTNVQKMVDKEGKQVPEYHAQGVANIDIGFRIYSPKDKNIFDEQSYKHRRVWNAVGSTATDAALHLMAKSEAVFAAGYDAGMSYAERITPHYVWVDRMYYKKGKKSEDIKIGARQAEVDQWDTAAKTWMNALNSPHKKDPGRAAYNIALAYEMQGDLKKALEWAQKSYSTYGNNHGREYAAVLQQRIQDQKRLDEQLGN